MLYITKSADAFCMTSDDEMNTNTETMKLLYYDSNDNHVPILDEHLDLDDVDSVTTSDAEDKFDINSQLDSAFADTASSYSNCSSNCSSDFQSSTRSLLEFNAEPGFVFEDVAFVMPNDFRDIDEFALYYRYSRKILAKFSLEDSNSDMLQYVRVTNAWAYNIYTYSNNVCRVSVNDRIKVLDFCLVCKNWLHTSIIQPDQTIVIGNNIEIASETSDDSISSIDSADSTTSETNTDIMEQTKLIKELCVKLKQLTFDNAPDIGMSAPIEPNSYIALSSIKLRSLRKFCEKEQLLIDQLTKNLAEIDILSNKDDSNYYFAKNSYTYYLNNVLLYCTKTQLFLFVSIGIVSLFIFQQCLKLRSFKLNIVQYIVKVYKK